MSNDPITPVTRASSGVMRNKGLSMTAKPRPILRQYETGAARERIERSLVAAGKDPHNLTAGDLALLEDFHTLGRFATTALADLASITAADHVLDAGTGIGGTARFLAHQIGCRVTAVDLAPEYCTIAEWLTAGVGLSERVTVLEADVLDLPFRAATFDVIVSQHVQMNIADKHRLYQEARRVLAPGGRLALWDVTAGPVQPIHFPVPWADRAELSHLATPDELHHTLEGAGFAISVWNDLTAPSIEFMQAFINAPPSPLGLHAFVPNFTAKVERLIANLQQDRARLIQAVSVAR